MLERAYLQHRPRPAAPVPRDPAQGFLAWALLPRPRVVLVQVKQARFGFCVSVGGSRGALLLGFEWGGGGFRLSHVRGGTLGVKVRFFALHQSERASAAQIRSFGLLTFVANSFSSGAAGQH